MVVSNSVGFPVACLTWKGPALPRAEILVWFVLQGCLNTRERLANLHIIPPHSGHLSFLCFCCGISESTSFWIHVVLEYLGILSPMVVFAMELSQGVY